MNAQTTLPSPRSAARAVLETAGIYAVAAALLVAGALVSPDFLTAENLLSILSGVALLGIVACGMAFVTYSGNMADLSLPATMAFSGIIAVASLSLGLVPALLLGMLAGLALSLIHI